MLQVPLQLWLVRKPQRQLVIVSSDWALVLSRGARPPAAGDSNEDESVVVELLPRQEVDLEQAALLHSRVNGCLGVLAVAGGSPVSFLWRDGLTQTDSSKLLRARCLLARHHPRDPARLDV